MKTFYVLILAFFAAGPLQAIDINTQNIRIIRDHYGVPHIYAKTDEEVAYGLGWATAEDDFKSMQENFLTSRGRLAEVKGKDGAIMDFLCAVIGARESVDKLYDQSFSPKFKGMLSAYVKAVNKYAETHPDEVWIKDAFPVTEKDIIVGYTLGLALMTNVQFDIMKISDGTIRQYDQLNGPKGSNGFAVNSHKTKDGNTYLAINSHQPLEGPYSWYEAHVHSEEGWNMLGGTFPGGITIFHGTNENLGWAHTVSFADYCDVYRLRMHPSEKLTYYYNGKWLKLEERSCRMKVKLFWFIKIPVTKKYYVSLYGPTLEHDGVYYALRFPAAFDIRGAEQWYHMNKARNIDEFKAALKMQALPGLNIIYADKNDNIFYIDNGQFPKRDPHYDWRKVLPGDTSATLWKANDYYPLESMVQVTNPPCGYIFNNNNTPFNCCSKENCPDPLICFIRPYYFPYDDNRSQRASYLFGTSGKLDYNDFKRIKYDQSFMNPAYNYSMINIEDVLHLDTQKYPQIKEAIRVLNSWNRNSDVHNKQAALVALIIHEVINKLIEEGHFPDVKCRVKEWFLVHAVEKAQAELLEYYGTLEVPLGDVQKLVRGNVELPVGGLPDVIAATYIKEYKDGKFQIDLGDSYIELVRYTKNGPLIESVSPYGASNKENSKHYTDQMALYATHRLKQETMNYEELMRNKESDYHPQ